MRRGVLVVTLSFATTGIASMAGAQAAQRSSITGVVTDTSDATIPGATISLTGTQLIGGGRTLETDRSGRYSFSQLLPGTYAVTASAPGMQTERRRDIALPVETTYDVNFVLEVAHVTQSVEVHSTSPLIDIHRASSPTVFSETVLHDVPTARTLKSVLSLTPGVTTTPAVQGIVGEVAFGGTQGSNDVTIDGVSLAESSLGTTFTGVNYNWLTEVQVIGLGASAEYGSFTGAVTNGVLRSGSNRVSVLGEWLQIPRRWTADNLANYPSGRENPASPRVIATWWDLNGQGGAPIVKDRLWLFAGTSHFHHEYRNASAGAATFPATEERESRSLLKLDAAPRRNIMLQGFATSDRDDLIGGGLSDYSPTLQSQPDVFTRTHAWNARSTWTHGSSLLVELRGSGTVGTASYDPHPPAARSGPTPIWDADTSTWCCNASQFGRDYRRTPTFAAAIETLRNSWFGTHQFRAGLEREHAPVESDSAVPTGRSLTISQGQVVGVQEWAGDHARSTTDRFSVFVQDRWTVSRRVTLEPGLRVDWNTGSLPSRSDVIATTGVGPRIGVAWDVTGRQTSVIRAHYGRYFDPLFGNFFQNFDLNAFSPRISYAVTPDGLMETDRSGPDVSPVVAIVRGLKQPHVDQWVIGGERSLGAHTTATAQYVRRQFGDFIGYLDRNGVAAYTSYTVMDPGPDGVFGTTDDAGPVVIYRRSSGADLVMANPPNAYRRYNGVQLIVTRRFAARWQSQASWAWSRSSGTVDTLYHTNAGFWSLSPGGVGTNPYAKSGRPTFDFSEFKADGSYHAPWLGGFTAGAVFRWHNGARWNRVVVMFDPFFTVYAAEPPGSRGGPWFGALDLRVEKSFQVPHSARIGAYVDVFNLTNVGRPVSFAPLSGPRFGQPNTWTDPRTARTGLRIEF